MFTNPLYAIHGNRSTCTQEGSKEFKSSAAQIYKEIAMVRGNQDKARSGDRKRGHCNEGDAGDTGTKRQKSSENGSATNGNVVLLEFDPQSKPSAREVLDKNEMLALIEERGLLENRDWMESEHHAIANILVGRSLDINPTNPNDAPLMKLAHRICNEYERSDYFLYLMEPPWVLFHTLPINPNHWQTPNNDGILDNANRAILCEAGSAHNDVGMIGCAITLPFPTNPFIVACRNAAERKQLVDLIVQELEKKLSGGAKGLSYAFTNATVPINYSM